MKHEIKTWLRRGIACAVTGMMLLSGTLAALPKGILAIPALEAKAVSGLDEGDYERQCGDFECLLHEDRVSLSILRYNGHDSELAIPAELDGLAVTEIGDEAFRDCTSLKSIIIPFGIKYIDTDVFFGCINLKSITISKSVISIQKKTFFDCPATIYGYAGSEAEKAAKRDAIPFKPLGQATHFENGFTYMVNADNEKDGTDVTILEYDNPDAETITIPDILGGLPIQRISDAVFADFTKLTTIRIPNTVTELGMELFAGCTSLKGVRIPDNVTVIPYGLFEYCSNLENVTVSTRVNRICMEAFEGCDSLKSIIYHMGTTNPSYSEKPWSSIYISDLGGNSVLNSVRILYEGNVPDNTPTDTPDPGKTDFLIEGNLLWRLDSEGKLKITGTGKMNDYTESEVQPPWDMEAIQSIDILDGVESIGDYAFCDCINLIAVTVPKSVISISDTAFQRCPSDIVFKGYPDSTAHQFARKHGYLFLSLNPVPEHVEWVEHNQGRFETLSTSKELQSLKDFLLKDQAVADYKWLKNLHALLSNGSDTEGAHDYAKETVDILIADILTDKSFHEIIAQNAEVYETDAKYNILCGIYNALSKGSSATDRFVSVWSDVLPDETKSFVIDRVPALMKARNSITSLNPSDAAFVKQVNEGWVEIVKGRSFDKVIPKIKDSLKEDSLTLNSDVLSDSVGFLFSEVAMLFEYSDKEMEIEKNYTNYINYALEFQSGGKALETAFIYLSSHLSQSCADVYWGKLGSGIDGNMLYSAFWDAKECIKDMNALDEYFTLLKKDNATELKTKNRNQIIKTVCFGLAKLFPPTAVGAWIMSAAEAGVSLMIWLNEQCTNVKDRAQYRDMSLYLIMFYDAIGNAMQTTFSEKFLKYQNVDKIVSESYQCFETGMMMYHKIHYLLADCSLDYLNLLEQEMELTLEEASLNMNAEKVVKLCEPYIGVPDLVGEYNDTKLTNYIRIPMNNVFQEQRDNIKTILSRTNELQCCDRQIANELHAKEHHALLVSCPVNITVSDGDTVIVDIQNDEIKTRSDSCRISMFKSDRSEYAEKYITYPSDCTVEITGFAEGTMDLMRISGEDSADMFYAADIPVTAGASYQETREDGQTVQIAYDLDADGEPDGTVKTSVPDKIVMTQKTVGDANCDGSVSIADLVAMRRAEVGEWIEHFSVMNADFTGDGCFDLADIVAIRRQLEQKESAV